MAVTVKQVRTVWGNKWVGLYAISGTYATGGFDIGSGTRTGIVLTDFGDTGTLTNGKIVLKAAGTELSADTAVAGNVIVVFS